MGKEKNEVIVAARIPKTLKQLMEKFIAADAHMGISELIRELCAKKFNARLPIFIVDFSRRLLNE